MSFTDHLSFHGELYSTAVTRLCVGLTQHVQKLMEFHHQTTWPQLFLAVFTHFYYQAGIKKMKKKNENPKQIITHVLISLSHDG